MSHLLGAAEAAGMGIGLEAKTAQQYVDTATGAQNAATQHQKAEAYHASRVRQKKLPPRLQMMRCAVLLKTSRLLWIKPIAPLMIRAECCLRRSLLLDLSQRA